MQPPLIRYSERFSIRFVLQDADAPYGPLTFHPHAVPLEQTEIEKFENKIGTQLPTLYREFLTYFGDSLITGATIKDVKLGVFFGLRANSGYRLDQEWDVCRHALKQMWLPINSDAGGNKVCLVMSKENYGAVYWCDHEDPNYCEKLASTFEQFLSEIEVSV